MTFTDPRRSTPRISVDGLCGVVTQRDLRPAAMVDLSSTGLRLELPFDAAAVQRSLQLEIELPGVDEIMWARGTVTFAQLTPLGGTHPNGQPRLWCRAGLHIDIAAARDRALLRDYVLHVEHARRAG